MHADMRRIMGVIVIAALVLSLCTAVAGCGKKKADTEVTTNQTPAAVEGAGAKGAGTAKPMPSKVQPPATDAVRTK